MRITDITANEKKIIEYFINHSKENNVPFYDVMIDIKDILNHLSITLDELDEIIEVLQDNQIIDYDFDINKNNPIRLNYTVFFKYDYLYQEYQISTLIPNVMSFLQESSNINNGYVSAINLQESCNLTDEETNIILSYLEYSNIFKQKIPIFNHYLDCNFTIDKRALKKL